MSSSAVRQTALRAGGACVRCRKGKTKCVYENGRAPCRNCAKGLHDCYLPSESNAHIHGQTPVRPGQPRPARESLPGAGAAAVDSRAPIPGSIPARGVPSNPEKIGQELIQECERVVHKTFPACVAFHKPSLIQQLKSHTLEASLTNALLCCAARSSPTLVRRYGGQSGATGAAEHFSAKAMARINENVDHPSLADIQALCLLVIHEWGSRNAVRAYIYLGQAARMLQMYHILNTHHAHPEVDRFHKDESWRRTLWLVYVLDCIMATTPGRYPVLSLPEYGNVSLPCADLNFAFGNAVYVKTWRLEDPPNMPPGGQPAEIGEFGHIVLATTIWSDVVRMLVASQHVYRLDTILELTERIGQLRASLPMQYIDKPGQINLHITMGSGITYAMIHCLLNCATVFAYRRRLLHHVRAEMVNVDEWKHTPQCHEIVDRLMASCHGTTSLLMALESGADKDAILCYPIFMLFSAFTASATVAYLSLKGLTPANSVETAGMIVKDGLHLMEHNVEMWPLIASWHRHLSVMQRVLNTESALAGGVPAVHGPTPSTSVKDEGSNAADSGNEGNDAEVLHPEVPAANMSVSGAEESPRPESEPPAARKSGFTTVNGGGGSVTPAASTPPPAPGSADAMVGVGPVAAPRSEDVVGVPADMTAAELCGAFEKQLLELDDLAAFMGGGV